MPETIDCDPKSLANAAKCYCYPENVSRGIEIYLLAQIAGDTSTPSELAVKAKCYCFDARTALQVENYLLCAIANKT